MPQGYCKDGASLTIHRPRGPTAASPHGHRRWCEGARTQTAPGMAVRCRDGKQDQLKLGVPLGGSREGAFTGKSWGKDFGNLCRCRDTAPPVLVGLEQGIRSFACTLLMENTSRPRPVCAAAVPVCPPRPLASLVAVVGVGSGSGLGEWLCSPGLPVSPEGTSGQAVGAPAPRRATELPAPARQPWLPQPRGSEQGSGAPQHTIFSVHAFILTLRVGNLPK